MNISTGMGPQRIVCLSTETTETLYLLGEERRIVGISGYTVRPSQARKEKPKVSAFSSAKIDKILALEPDLVLGFSDMQADIAAQLIRAGVEAHIFNQRSVTGIFDMMRMLGAIVGVPAKAEALITELHTGLLEIMKAAAPLPRKPCIYFEEWNDPLISAVRWVSELIHIAGGNDCFADLATAADAKRRIITDSDEVIRRAPDIIIGSWCGKRFQPDEVKARVGWHTIPAVSSGNIYEIKSSDILQPGPAALTDGVRQIHAIVQKWAAAQA